MEVPVGFLAKLWSFVSFLPFFLSLFVLGLLKAALIGQVAVGIIFFGNSAVILGLWTVHFAWTYYCMARTRKLGPALKILLLVSMPVALLLWPVLGVVGSLLGGIGYGFFAPLLATFEAVGENVTDKSVHCFSDGCLSTIKGSCTVVADFTDLCFHSYFSYMDEMKENPPVDEKPLDIELSILPSCFVVVLLGLPADILLITGVTLCKSPYMLFKGWKRLLEDLIGREGPFLETVCVPFAGVAIILWPLAVVGAIVGAIISSFFLGLYGGVIVYQEESLQMGLAYILSAVSLFDEYTNDLLYMREGSCLPRPIYRKNMSSSSNSFLERRKSYDTEEDGLRNLNGGPSNLKLVSEGAKTLKWSIQHYKPVQVLDWLFKSSEENGRLLLHEGLIEIKDIEECIIRGKSRKLCVKLPAWSIFQCLIASAKSNSSGLIICMSVFNLSLCRNTLDLSFKNVITKFEFFPLADTVELTKTNCSRDKVLEWYIGPLLIIKEQIKVLQILQDEEMKRLIMDFKSETTQDWDDSVFSSDDCVRRAQVQAIIRRLLGIVSSMSRIPTFRRRFRNLVKVLYLEAIGIGTPAILV